MDVIIDDRKPDRANMKEEVLAAVMFFIRFIEKSETFPSDQIENFKRHLTELLLERFEKHWFPNFPTKGQGYRCIRVNCVSPVDLTLQRAASKCGLSYRDLRLPTELTVWVDPNEVCYRLGESEGSYCTLATFSSSSSSDSSSESSSGSTTPLSSPPSTPSQEKPRRSPQQRGPSLQQALRYNPAEYPTKFRNHPANANVAVSSLRMKPSPREMNFNFSPNRPTYRCDGPPYPMTPTFYRNMNYNRTHYKNVVRV